MSAIGHATEFEIGYLAGLVDGEGYIFVRYTKPSDRTRPLLRIYCTSHQIISGACRIMGVNPYARTDKGKLMGWVASVQGEKALGAMRAIAPHLKDASKRCRALTSLKIFNSEVSIRGRHPSSELFLHCPPPARLRRKGAERPLDADRPCSDAGDELSLPDPSPETSDLRNGWFCGIVDGEGHIHVRYRSDRDTIYPRLRIFGKSRPIIDAAARIMEVNPYARRSHGKHLGWYVSVSHLKALKVLRMAGPHLLEPSKSCRARKILERFGDVGTIHSRISGIDFFSGCPPPSRIRKSGSIINGR
jgi:hypothetical protein